MTNVSKWPCPPSPTKWLVIWGSGWDEFDTEQAAKAAAQSTPGAEVYPPQDVVFGAIPPFDILKANTPEEV